MKTLKLIFSCLWLVLQFLLSGYQLTGLSWHYPFGQWHKPGDPQLSHVYPLYIGF